MGSVRKEYSIFDFDVRTSTRSVKEMLEYLPIDKSCTIAMNLVHLACLQINSAVTRRKKIDHEFIVQMMRIAMDKHAKSVFNWQIRDNLLGDVKFICDPKVKGGERYNLNCCKTNQTIEFDVIEVTIGVSYKSHECYYFRTLLINPTEKAKANYNFLTLIKRVIFYNLRDGIELCKVYQCAMSFAENSNRHLVKHLYPRFGFALSREGCQNQFTAIESSTSSIAKCGMVFAINVNLKQLKEAERVYNLSSFDTVLVRKNVPAEVITHFQRTRFDTIIDINADRDLENSSSSHHNVQSGLLENGS